MLLQPERKYPSPVSFCLLTTYTVASPCSPGAAFAALFHLLLATQGGKSLDEKMEVQRREEPAQELSIIRYIVLGFNLETLTQRAVPSLAISAG